jgi:hypothetical protein
LSRSPLIFVRPALPHIQHDETADSKTPDSAQGCHLGEVCAQTETIRKDGADRKYDACHIEPAGSPHRVRPQPELQEDGREPDGCHNDDREWTVKCGSTRVEHNQRNGKNE